MMMTTQSTTRRRMRRTAAPPTAPPTTATLVFEAALDALVLGLVMPESMILQERQKIG